MNSNFSEGDEVWILEKQTLRKGSKLLYSSEMYMVKNNFNQWNSKKAQHDIKKIKEYISNSQAIIQKVTKGKSVEWILKSAGID